MLTDLEHIKLADRPLVVCDVDDVVLQFATPFEAFLTERDLRLLPRSFKLTGNIVDAADAVLDALAVRNLIHDFFVEQERWQTPFAEAVDSLHALAAEADLVFLTAMPPRHAEIRRRLLDRLTLSYPMISSEDPKGPIVARLHGERPLPVAFVDDMLGNLSSVGEHVPESALVYLPPDVAIFRFAPEPQAPVLRARDWLEARQLIEAHFRD
ncbi:hypothetical protein ASE36_00715 [Rhizobium sp. Root274]|uniref:hypothetical protein n=1 Tax=unclassified Rhizobium TaxID=2613769 RepID=UPI000714F022|nr:MULTISPECIES: hypothetical protein [unclassified Rhizobium]KQW30859.1 hypothetical protein ASC71_00720 [Rhizobium sp. Root1240]KRD32404.1 hypothetical protein ASE36_00715 [Rhizobium sp. Root274]